MGCADQASRLTLDPHYSEASVLVMILFIVLACPGHPASLTGAGMFLVSSFNIPERVLIYGWMDRSGLAFRIFSAWLGCERRQVSSYFSWRLFLSLFHEERDNEDGERRQVYRMT
jgi:hypothetical protein